MFLPRWLPWSGGLLGGVLGVPVGIRPTLWLAVVGWAVFLATIVASPALSAPIFAFRVRLIRLTRCQAQFARSRQITNVAVDRQHRARLEGLGPPIVRAASRADALGSHCTARTNEATWMSCFGAPSPKRLRDWCLQVFRYRAMRRGGPTYRSMVQPNPAGIGPSLRGFRSSCYSCRYTSSSRRSVRGITGYSREGINRAIDRDSVGVSPRAILDAVRSPLQVERGRGGATIFRGRYATVIRNAAGRIITAWANNRGGWRKS